MRVVSLLFASCLFAPGVAQKWVPIDVAPPGRQRLGMVTDTARQRIVLFGGQGREDTWVFDGAGWTQLTTNQLTPPRDQFSYAFDAARGDVVVFGGIPAFSWSTQLNTTWRLRGNTWSQVPTTIAPPGRIFAAMAFDQARGEIVLFGGFDILTSTFLGDTWCWNGAAWQQRFPATSPPPLWMYSMVDDPVRQRIVLVDTWHRSTWEWDGTNWQQHPAPTFAQRFGAALAYRPDVQRVVLFGGDQDVNQPTLNDTWQYDGSSWTPLAVTGAPPGRSRHGLAWDPVARRLITFGGIENPNYGHTLADTWGLAGSSWGQVQHPEQPADVQALTYDSVRSRFVALTGNGSPVMTWEYDGLWHRCPSALVPPIGWSHQIAFDPLRNLTFTLTPAPDHRTWQWDGMQWLERITANRPPSRVQFALAFDPSRGVLVLFGGYQFWHFNDTWEFDGVDWQQRTPLQSPPGLSRAAMAFHPASNRLVLFGGVASPNGPLSDGTWEYDGSTWTPRPLSVRPPGRHGAALALDPMTGDLVLSGGSTFTGGSTNTSVRDAWRWNGNAWTPTQPQAIYTIPWQRAAADAHNAIMSDGERWWRWTSAPAATPTTGGNGCGNPTPALVVDARPYLGNALFRVHVEPTLPSVLFALYADTATTVAPLGGSCTQYLLNPRLFCLGTTTASGVGSASLPIPRLPALRGCVLHLQGLAGQPGGPLQGVAAVTGRVTIVLGD
jgi:hypothetical protein